MLMSTKKCCNVPRSTGSGFGPKLSDIQRPSIRLHYSGAAERIKLGPGIPRLPSSVQGGLFHRSIMMTIYTYFVGRYCVRQLFRESGRAPMA